nr:glycoside hydrolase family 55 protein [Elstera litoralis]
MDYGALPDGSDSTSAFAQALTAANGRPVFVPAGTFRLNGPLTVTAPVDNHGFGPQLFGEGKDISIMDYRGTGTLLTCQQTVGYRFLKNGLISNMTLTGKSDIPDQSALSLTGAFDWYLNSIVIKNFGGDAVKSPLVSTIYTEMTDVSKTAGSNELTRAAGGFLTRLSVGMGISGPGVPVGSIVTQLVSDFIVKISFPTTLTEVSSIYVIGNSDAIQSILHVQDTEIIQNGGYGIAGYSGLGLILYWKNTKVQANGAGVLIGSGADIDGGVIAGNGTAASGDQAAGLRVARINSGPQNLSVRKIEFDSNYGAQIRLEYLTNGLIEQCRFISHLDGQTNTTMIPNKGVVFGGTLGAAAVATVILEQCSFRADAQGGIAYDGIYLGDTGTYNNITVDNPTWITLTAPNQKKFNKYPHADANTRMYELGKLTVGNPVSNGYVFARGTAVVDLPAATETTIPFPQVLRGDATILTTGIPNTGLWQFDVTISLSDLGTTETGTFSVIANGAVKTLSWAANGQSSLTINGSFPMILSQSTTPPVVKLRRNGGTGVARVNFAASSTTLYVSFIG